jgi:MFS family permease
MENADNIQTDFIGFHFSLQLTDALFGVVNAIVGALAVLRPRHLVPEGFQVAVTQAHILREIMGQPGWILMLVVAFATLFSTQLTLVDGVARSISDILYVNYDWAKKRSLSWWYAVIAGGWILIGCALAGFKFPPLLLLITGACMGGVAMAVYCPMTLYINMRFLPKEMRPDWISRIFLGWATLLYSVFALYTLWQVLTQAWSLLGG